MNNYRKLYIIGFTTLSIAIGMIVWFVYLILGEQASMRNKKLVTPTSNVEEFPDTVFREKVVERVIHDTVIRYIKPKPTVTVDTTKKVPSTTSTQSPN